MDADVTVVLVDNHPLLIKGVQALLAEGRPPVRTVASGPTVAAAFGPGAGADVVVLDLKLDHPDPWHTDLERLVAAGRKVVVYTDLADTTTARRCQRLGALAYVTKGEVAEHLADAVRAVAAGADYVTPSMARVVVEDAVEGHVELSAMQLRACIAYCAGTMATAAAALNISGKTCENHVQRARDKWRRHGRAAGTKAQLVQRLIEYGVAPDELGGPQA